MTPEQLRERLRSMRENKETKAINAKERARKEHYHDLVANQISNDIERKALGNEEGIRNAFFKSSFRGFSSLF